MKILLINKYNFVKGGSEVYTFGLKKMLIEYGHEVIDFSMKNEKNLFSLYDKFFVDEVDYSRKSIKCKIRNSVKLIYSKEAYDRLCALIEETKPDIAHVNLIYHQLTPSILHALKKNNIPIVFTSHDYKIICPNYKLYNRDLCEECIGGKYINCVKNGCHKNSRVFSLLLTIEAYVNKYIKSYELCDKIICPSKFMKEKLIQHGFDEKKLIHIPNFINPNYYFERQKYKDVQKERTILYYGRLSEEKGILNLLKAVNLTRKDFTLKIIGVGPQMKQIEDYIEKKQLFNVKLLGFKSGEELFEEISKAYCTVIPSIWHEVFGLTIIESYAFGTPVIGANLGGISEIIKDEVTGFKFNDVEELALKIQRIFDMNSTEYDNMRNMCFYEAEKYAPEKIGKMILGIYYNQLKNK